MCKDKSVRIEKLNLEEFPFLRDLYISSQKIYRCKCNLILINLIVSVKKYNK